MTKSVTVIISVILIVTFILGFLYMQQLSTEMNNATTIFATKKNDLLARQQDLERTITNLNNTLSEAKSKELALSNQLASLSGTSTTPTSSSTPPASSTTTQTQTVTRAS